MSTRILLNVFATATLVLAMMWPNFLSAQSINWAFEGYPSARCCMGMAYDPATHTIVMFGGADNGKNFLNDTWFWRDGWHAISPKAYPSTRVSPGMAFDGTGIVLFGGTTKSGEPLGDTWTWNGKTWTQQFPPVSPSPRSTTMVYDVATGTTVLFGGADASGYLGDTWIWNGNTKTWAQQNPVTSPSPRAAPMTYIASNQTVFLFGGNTDNTEYTDTWTWNGTTWKQLFPASTPPARTAANMTYDPSHGSVILFGGFAGSWPNSLNDTWTWDGTQWSEAYPASVPPNRYSFGLNYDPVNRVDVMFGGYSSGPARGDTWVLSLHP